MNIVIRVISVIIMIIYILDLSLCVARILGNNRFKFSMSIKQNTVVGIFAFIGLFYTLAINYNMDIIISIVASICSGTIIALICRFFVVKPLKNYNNK